MPPLFFFHKEKTSKISHINLAQRRKEKMGLEGFEPSATGILRAVTVASTQLRHIRPAL